jgi:hypothetical protein
VVSGDDGSLRAGPFVADGGAVAAAFAVDGNAAAPMIPAPAAAEPSRKERRGVPCRELESTGSP